MGREEAEAYARSLIAHRPEEGPEEVPFDYLYHPDGDRWIDCEGTTWAIAVWKRWREMGLPEAAVRAVLGNAADADPAALPGDAADGALVGPGRTPIREDALVGLAVAHGWAVGHCEDGFNSLASLNPTSKRMERATEYLAGRFGAKAAPSLSGWEPNDNFRLAMAMRLVIADAARQDRFDAGLLSPECLEAVAALAGARTLGGLDARTGDAALLEPLLRRARALSGDIGGEGAGPG